MVATDCATDCTGNQLQPVATEGGNCGCQSSSVSVVVATNSENPKTGPGLIASKKGKKTGLDWTFKHYVLKGAACYAVGTWWVWWWA